MNRIIPLHRTQNSRYEIVVLAASLADSAVQAIQSLRENKVVILQLSDLEEKQAQRVLDFLCGSAYAISAHSSKLGKAVFLFTPYNIQTNLVPSSA